MSKIRKSSQKSLRQVQREVIFRQQGGRCAYCNCQMILKTKGARRDAPLPANFATLDHRLAKALGGGDQIDNLVVSCHRCNNAKSLVEYRSSQSQLGYRP